MMKKGEIYLAFSNKNTIKVPNHLAIILDGNGRWALKKGLVRSIGHKVGANTLKEIISYCYKVKVKYLSLFCFSTENWKRNENEVSYLFSLINDYFNNFEQSFIDNGIKVIISGDLSKLPLLVRLTCEKLVNKTKSLNNFIVNFCINYGGKDEIVNACKKIAFEVKNKLIDASSIDKTMFEKYLYSKELPDIDLLIRTSNEKRISNFMLYKLAYSEFYFTKKYWPAFKIKDLNKAFKEFSKRKRKFGGV